MNEKFHKNAKGEQLTENLLSREEEKGLIVKVPWIGLFGGKSLYLTCPVIEGLSVLNLVYCKWALDTSLLCKYRRTSYENTLTQDASLMRLPDTQF